MRPTGRCSTCGTSSRADLPEIAQFILNELAAARRLLARSAAPGAVRPVAAANPAAGDGDGAAGDGDGDAARGGTRDRGRGGFQRLSLSGCCARPASRPGAVVQSRGRAGRASGAWRAAAHRGPAPGDAAGDFLATVSAPISHHGHATGHHKKKSDESLGTAIALVALSFIVVLGFLAFYLGQPTPPSDPGGADQPLIGPGQQVIHVRKLVPVEGDTNTDRPAERPADAASRSRRQTCRDAPTPPKAQEEFGGDSYGDIPVAPNVDRSAPVIPQPNPGVQPKPAPPHADQANGGQPGGAQPAPGNANPPEPAGLDPALKKDTLDKAVQ